MWNWLNFQQTAHGKHDSLSIFFYCYNGKLINFYVYTWIAPGFIKYSALCFVLFLLLSCIYLLNRNQTAQHLTSSSGNKANIQSWLCSFISLQSITKHKQISLTFGLLDVPWWVRNEAQHRLFLVLGLITLFWAALLNWPAAQFSGFPGDLGSPVMSWSETTITYNYQSTYKPFV